MLSVVFAHVDILYIQRVRLCREGGGGDVCSDQFYHHQGAGSCLPRLLRTLATTRQQPQPRMEAQRPPLHPHHRSKERRGNMHSTLVPFLGNFLQIGLFTLKSKCYGETVRLKKIEYFDFVFCFFSKTVIMKCIQDSLTYKPKVILSILV